MAEKELGAHGAVTGARIFVRGLQKESRGKMTDGIAAATTRRLRRIQSLRQKRQDERVHSDRKALSAADRAAVLAKTAGHCHICGGKIRKECRFDHVRAHSGGGSGDVSNYLPAHALCNGYKWCFLPEEFQLILKLGVWARKQIEDDKAMGKEIGHKFAKYDIARIRRRRRREGTGATTREGSG